jgi:replicative DNA helicase
MIEHELIASLLVYPEKLGEAKDVVSSSDFLDDKCRVIWEEMERQGKFDYVTLTAKFRSDNQPIVEVLKSLNGTGGSDVTSYAKIVREASKKRETVRLAKELIESTGSDLTVNELIENVNERLLSLYETPEKGFRNSNDMIIDYLARLVMLAERGEDISGMTTGWRTLDLCLDGLQPSKLYVIGARPSQGKTSCMTQIAYHVAVVLKKTVAMFSIESPEITILDKMISQHARVETKKLRTGRLTADEKSLVMMQSDLLASAKFFMNDVSSINIYKIRSTLRKLCAEGNKPDLICLDYIQIVETDKGSDSKASKVGKVCQGLKNIAKELNVPVIVLGQLNRGVEADFPTLFSLKDSGDIEQIADAVILLHRPEFYLKGKTPEDQQGKIFLDCAKNREGEVLTMQMNWTGNYTLITE